MLLAPEPFLCLVRDESQRRRENSARAVMMETNELRMSESGPIHLRN